MQTWRCHLPNQAIQQILSVRCGQSRRSPPDLKTLAFFVATSPNMTIILLLTVLFFSSINPQYITMYTDTQCAIYDVQLKLGSCLYATGIMVVNGVNYTFDSLMMAIDPNHGATIYFYAGSGCNAILPYDIIFCSNGACCYSQCCDVGGLMVYVRGIKIQTMMVVVGTNDVRNFTLGNSARIGKVGGKQIVVA